MKKKVFAFMLAFTTYLSLVSAFAFEIGPSITDTYLSDWEHINNTQWMYQHYTARTTRCCMSVNEKGELFVYQFRIENDDLDVSGTHTAKYCPELTIKIADNVQKVCEVSPYEGTLGVLKKDGTFWLFRPNIKNTGGYDEGTFSSFFSPLMVFKDVIDITFSKFLTKSGELYGFSLPTSPVDRYSPISEDSCQITLEADNVKCISSSFYSSGENVMSFYKGDSFFPAKLDGRIIKLYEFEHTGFAITEKGTLWSWGNNSNGEAGNGGKWHMSSVSGVGGSFGPGRCEANLSSKPHKILPDIVYMYKSGTNRICALDVRGNIWEWGYGKSATAILKADQNSEHGIVISAIELPEDMTGWVPQKASHIEEYRELHRTDGVLQIYTDGTIKTRMQIYIDTGGVVREDNKDLDGNGVEWTVLPSWKVDTFTALAPIPDESIPSSGTAKASAQMVTVDGKSMEFQMYALFDADGNSTNYINLRDMAYVLNGTKAQFAVDYNGAIALTTGESYVASGAEMKTPFSGDQAYTGGIQSVQVNGKPVDMTAITLHDNQGGGYNYFKLRDLGKALGFNVGYSNEHGVFIESGKPYQG